MFQASDCHAFWKEQNESRGLLLVLFIFFRKKQVAMYLLSVGANVTIQAKNGCTAFDMASLIGMLSFLVIYLL